MWTAATAEVEELDEKIADLAERQRLLERAGEVRIQDTAGHDKPLRLGDDFGAWDNEASRARSTVLRNLEARNVPTSDDVRETVTDAVERDPKVAKALLARSTRRTTRRS